MRTSDHDQEKRVAELVRRAPHVMRALSAAREVDPPDWLICAGAIRDAVWDALHGVSPSALPRDIDLAFFDPDDLTSAREQELQARVAARSPDLPWEVKNQAAVHLWYPQRFGTEVPPLRCSAEAVGTFPETASCVGVRLLADDQMLIVAPHGLDDLLGCVCRHNPTRVPESLYRARQAEKQWPRRWPRVVIA